MSPAFMSFSYKHASKPNVVKGPAFLGIKWEDHD